MRFALAVEHLTKRFGDFTAVDRVSFSVEDGKFFSILGPSGCGKTTLLRMIAGFYQQDEGTILLNNEDMAQVAPNRRPVNLVFQNLALFPMMNVYENIAFGLRRRKEKPSEVDRKVKDILKRVGLPDAGKRQINQLSGGQKQRIAIARCLVLDPAVLLLDEPLGSLDAKLREHMKVELKNLQAQVGTTFVYITHDQSEAMVMSDAVAVMKEGRFEQIGTPQELYYHPSSSFVAQFVGSNNKLRVTLHRDEHGNMLARYGQHHDFSVGSECRDNEEGEYDLFIRPESFIINPQPADTSNMLPVEVQTILFDGGNSRLLVIPEGTEDEVVVAFAQTGQYDRIAIHDRIHIGWEAAKAMCFKRSEWKLYDEK